MMSRVDRRVDRNRRIHKQSEQNVINSIIRSYFIASGKMIDKVRYYFRFNVNQFILQRFALRRVARMLRSQQSANLKKLSDDANLKRLSDVDTSENWDNSDVSLVCCEVSRVLTRRDLATLTRLRTETKAMTRLYAAKLVKTSLKRLRKSANLKRLTTLTRLKTETIW